MLLAVVILKSAVELSLMFIVGRGVLGLLVGTGRTGNPFWQLLDIVARPALWLTRRISPKIVLNRHIPLAAAGWLLLTWVLLVKMKIDLCLGLAAAVCKVS